MSVSLEQQLLVFSTAVMLVSVNPTDACYDESKIELGSSDIASIIRSRTQHMYKRGRVPPQDVHVRKSDIEKIFKSKIMRKYLTNKRFFTFIPKPRKPNDGGVVYCRLRYPSLVVGCYYEDKIDCEERVIEYTQTINKIAKALLFEIFEDTFGTLALRFNSSMGKIREKLKDIKEKRNKEKEAARKKRDEEEKEKEEERRLEELRYTYIPMIAAST